MAFSKHSDADEDLLDLLKTGDGRAMERIFGKYHPSLCASAYRIVQDRDAARDVVQEVFIRLWHGRAALQITHSLKAYLHRSAVNGALHHLERTQRMARVPLQSAEELAGEGGNGAGLEARDLQAALAAAVDALPPVCRTVFMLSRHDELSNAEIADCLGVSVKAVEKHLTKALGRLREAVARCNRS
jgi:RNA polymerase sigma-70 factor (ECF subfamily)